MITSNVEPPETQYPAEQPKTLDSARKIVSNDSHTQSHITSITVEQLEVVLEEALEERVHRDRRVKNKERPCVFIDRRVRQRRQS